MLAFIRKFSFLIFWWLVVFACILFIGYVAWPLLFQKFGSLCANPDWKFCHADWGGIENVDKIQSTVEHKTTSFLDIVRTAISDILSDDGGKQPVEYKLDEQTGMYTSTPIGK